MKHATTGIESGYYPPLTKFQYEQYEGRIELLEEELRKARELIKDLEKENLDLRRHLDGLCRQSHSFGDKNNG